jgi:DNA-binding MarR family transcriptional regulator
LFRTMNSTGFFDLHSLPIDHRLATGLYTIGRAVRHQERRHARAVGLSPTQSQILALLSDDSADTPSAIADALGVSLPTISDSVRALVAKKLVTRTSSPHDHRATELRLTRAGRAEAQRAASLPEFLVSSLRMLSDSRQQVLLSVVVALLRAMQEEGHVPAQRMCLTCTFFRQRVRDGARPHHCALVDAPMAPTHLRLACDEHAAAPAATQSAQWRQFVLDEA